MEFVIFCIEAVQKYIFINILLLKKVFNIIFLNYNYCDLILYPSLTMSNFKMIKIFFLKLELQLGMPENQIIKKACTMLSFRQVSPPERSSVRTYCSA